MPTLLLDFASKQSDKKMALSMLMNSKTSLEQLYNLFKLFDEASELYNINTKEYHNAWEVLYSIDYHVSWGLELKKEWQEEALYNLSDAQYCDKEYGKYLKIIFQTEIDNLLINVVNNSSNSIYKNV